jgi:3-oxoacyl-[acyl-carrier protein] reductase
MDLGLTGKTALVAGGGRGIGAAVARLLAKEGARVGVLSRNTDEVTAVATDIAAAGGEAVGLPCDLCDPPAIALALAKLAESFGPAQILVHTAAAHFAPKKLHNMSDAEIAHLLDVDLQSAARLCARVVPDMMLGRFGRIVLVGSLAGHVGVAGGPMYATSKVALEGLARGLALDYSRYGICANVARLGFVSSERFIQRLGGDDAHKERLLQSTATRRIPTPEDAAAPIVFLCAEQAWPITGAAVEVTAGSHLNTLW